MRRTSHHFSHYGSQTTLLIFLCIGYDTASFRLLYHSLYLLTVLLEHLHGDILGRGIEPDHALGSRPDIVAVDDSGLSDIRTDVGHKDVSVELEHCGKSAWSHIHQVVHRLPLWQERKITCQ